MNAICPVCRGSGSFTIVVSLDGQTAEVECSCRRAKNAA